MSDNKYDKPSSDKDVLNISVRIISEFIQQEYAKGDSINNRANMCVCLMGIYSAVIIGLGSLIFQSSTKTSLFFGFLYLSIILVLIIAVYCSLKVILVKQIDKLSPKMINDIRDFTEVKALQYEVKWKMWEYEQLNAYNVNKLFCLHRTQRGLLISSTYLLFIGILFYFNTNIIAIEKECYFKCFELVIGCLIVAFSAFSNQILEKYTFWNK